MVEALWSTSCQSAYRRFEVMMPVSDAIVEDTSEQAEEELCLGQWHHITGTDGAIGELRVEVEEVGGRLSPGTWQNGEWMGVDESGAGG